MWYTTIVIDFCAPPARDIDYGLCAKNFALHTLSGFYSVLVGQLRPFRGKRLKCRHFFIYLFSPLWQEGVVYGKAYVLRSGDR